MTITFRMVEAFRAVMLTGGVTKAAEMLHVSQPSVTRLVHDLESVLGWKLFVPDGRRVKPTEDALTLYQEVEYSFASLARLEAVGKRLNATKLRTLRVACLPALGLTLLPLAVRTLTLATKAHIEVQVVSSKAGLQLVKENRFDVALGLVSNAGRGLAQIAEVAGECRVILPPGHPDRRRRSMALADLIDAPLVTYSENTETRTRLDAAFSREDLQPNYVAEASSSIFISSLVMQGDHIGVVDSFTALNHVRSGGHAVALKPSIDFSVGAFAVEGRARHPLVDSLLDELQRANRDSYRVNLSSSATKLRAKQQPT